MRAPDIEIGGVYRSFGGELREVLEVGRYGQIRFIVLTKAFHAPRKQVGEIGWLPRHEFAKWAFEEVA